MKFWTKVKLFFSQIFSSVFGQVLLTSVSALVQVAGKAALDEIIRKGKDRASRLENEYPNGASDLKRKELADYLGDVGVSLGLNLSATLVNLLIEIIVSAIKYEPVVSTPSENP